MTTQKKATLEQASRILQMMTGKNPIIDRVLAQAIIQNNVLIANEYNECVAFWEGVFPGKGEALWQVFRPFYVKPLVLQPALLDLEERVKKAAVSSTITGVRVVRLNDRDEESDCNTAVSYAGFSEWTPDTYLLDWLEGISGELSDSIPESSWEFSGAIKDYRCYIWNEVLQNTFLEKGEVIAGVWGLIANALLGMLEYTGLALCAGNSAEADRFKPFLDLCLAGNFPFGLDEDRNLLVLCW
jgi:hypothetical protein